MNAYYNTSIQVPGRNNKAIELAADRLMPPQYHEFIRALQGDSGLSRATINYWLEKYEMFVEISEEE